MLREALEPTPVGGMAVINASINFPEEKAGQGYCSTGGVELTDILCRFAAEHLPMFRMICQQLTCNLKEGALFFGRQVPGRDGASKVCNHAKELEGGERQELDRLSLTGRSQG